LTGADAIREQLADLNLRILIEKSLKEWKGLAVLKSTGDKWEDRKI
jgi:DNA-directed RNA polymerase subunit beta'